MNKYAPLALFLFVSQLHAMKMIRQDPLIPCDAICYLNQMPCDILDYIASFLMETEEEFIERTRIKTEITNYDDIVLFGHFGLEPARSELCPDEKKYLVLGRKCWVKMRELTHHSAQENFHEDMMMIVDSLKSENFEDLDKKVSYKETLMILGNIHVMRYHVVAV